MARRTAAIELAGSPGVTQLETDLRRRRIARMLHIRRVKLPHRGSGERAILDVGDDADDLDTERLQSRIGKHHDSPDRARVAKIKCAADSLISITGALCSASPGAISRPWSSWRRSRADTPVRFRRSGCLYRRACVLRSLAPGLSWCRRTGEQPHQRITHGRDTWQMRKAFVERAHQGQMAFAAVAA